MDMAGGWTFVRRNPSALLLAVQLLGVVLYPFVDAPGGQALLGLFGLLVLLLAVWTVRTTPALTWVAILLGIPVAVLTIAEAVAPTSREIAFVSGLLHAAFYFYTSYGLIRYMFRDRFVSTGELFATGATFTVVAWAFAYLYQAVQAVWPGSFIAAVDPNAQRTWIELLYLSFTTLTSTGLSDIVPVVAQARSVVMIEMVAGMMYIVLVLSRVVGLTLARQRA